VLLLTLALAPAAAAAPVSVDLRIEGKTRTLYEAKVTTDTRAVDLHDGTGSHACDGTGNPDTPTPGPTRGAAFIAAAEGPGGFTFTGSYSFDMQFTVIAGDSVAFDPASNEFLAEYKNGQFASFGSCADQIASGDKVLYAYATGSEQLLELSGPPTIAPGVPATLRVTDAGTGAAVAGASVGGQTTGSDGTAQVTLGAAGPATFKASKPGAIRSNAVTVCATTGSDAACGTIPVGAAVSTAARDTLAPLATLIGIREGQRFTRGRGPRTLRARVAPDPSGLLMVKLRLTRIDRGSCTYFSGKAERFRLNDRGRCGAPHGFWFSVGDKNSIDYLLPSRLPRGRYVLDVKATDKAFNRDDARKRGANRVVFRVA